MASSQPPHLPMKRCTRTMQPPFWSGTSIGSLAFDKGKLCAVDVTVFPHDDVYREGKESSDLEVCRLQQQLAERIRELDDAGARLAQCERELGAKEEQAARRALEVCKALAGIHRMQAQLRAPVPICMQM